VKNEQFLTEEQMDYLTEMMNIGAGNAATALEQLFKCSVDVKVPEVRVVPSTKAVAILDSPSVPYAGVRMDMLGDITGVIFLIMPLEQKKQLMEVIEKSIPFKIKPGELDITVLEEVGNIAAGVYLMALHDFCKLNIVHTVPVLKVDMLQSILDEAVVRESIETQLIIIIKNEFILSKKKVKAAFIIALMPSKEKLNTLLHSIKGATDAIMRR